MNTSVMTQKEVGTLSNISLQQKKYIYILSNFLTPKPFSGDVP